MDYSPCVCVWTCERPTIAPLVLQSLLEMLCWGVQMASFYLWMCQSASYFFFHMHTHTQGAPGHGPPVPASPSDSQRVGKHATGPRSPHHHQVSGECHMNHIKRLAYFKKLMLVVEMCFWNPFICCVCHSEFLTCVNQDNDSLACIALFSASFMYTSSIFLFVF